MHLTPSNGMSKALKNERTKTNGFLKDGANDKTNQFDREYTSSQEKKLSINVTGDWNMY